MLKLLIILVLTSFQGLCEEPWVAYGTVSIPPYEYVDNPTCNSNGVFGEISLPYTVPKNHNLIILYIQVEGITYNIKTRSKKKTKDFALRLWIGNHFDDKSRGVFSCSTALGESNQCNGMYIIIPENKIVNIRCINNGSSTRSNSFFIQGILDNY